MSVLAGLISISGRALSLPGGGENVLAKNAIPRSCGRRSWWSEAKGRMLKRVLQSASQGTYKAIATWQRIAPIPRSNILGILFFILRFFFNSKYYPTQCNRSPYTSFQLSRSLNVSQNATSFDGALPSLRLPILDSNFATTSLPATFSLV